MVNIMGLQKIAQRMYADFLVTLGPGAYDVKEVRRLADTYIRNRMVDEEFPREKRDLLYDAFFDCDDEKYVNDTRS